MYTKFDPVSTVHNFKEKKRIFNYILAFYNNTPAEQVRVIRVFVRVLTTTVKTQKYWTMEAGKMFRELMDSCATMKLISTESPCNMLSASSLEDVRSGVRWQ